VIDVVLPVLNECGALPDVLGAMPRGYRPVVVDNGSHDGSADLARSLGATVVEEAERGLGAACFAGLMAAEGDVVCFMDCDGSLDPRDLPLVTDPVIAGEADLMLAGSMRAARRRALIRLGIADRGAGWPREMVLRATHAGWRIGETRIAFRAA
jgi:glycosyltransferase involved in cell wall biosynthesis